MKHLIRLFALTFLPVLGLPALGQLAPGSSDVPGLDQALRKLFGNVEGFTSTALMTIGGDGHTITMPVETSMLHGDTRSEVDLAKVEGANLPPQMLTQLQKVGMDRIVTLSKATDGSSLMIYPGMKSYAVVVPPKASKGDAKPAEPAMEKTVLGTEEVDGKSCEKSTVTFKGEGVQEIAMTVWADKSNKNRPVKIATSQSGVNLTMVFKNFKETKPDGRLFVAPDDYHKYNSVQELMMANMQKLMPAQPAK